MTIHIVHKQYETRALRQLPHGWSNAVQLLRRLALLAVSRWRLLPCVMFSKQLFSCRQPRDTAVMTPLLCGCYVNISYLLQDILLNRRIFTHVQSSLDEKPQKSYARLLLVVLIVVVVF